VGQGDDRSGEPPGEESRHEGRDQKGHDEPKEESPRDPVEGAQDRIEWHR